MPIPNTKIFLNSTILAGGGFPLKPNAAGDFTLGVTGVASGSWVAGVGDLNGDGVADIVIGSAGDDDKAADGCRADLCHPVQLCAGHHGVCSGWGRNPTLKGSHRFLGHLYSPVRRMCAHPRGEMWARRSAGVLWPSCFRLAAA